MLPYGYTDHLHDEETGLIYANARYLDPKTSRWLSTDPAMADGLNWYRYANNNPIMYRDPSGLRSSSWAGDRGFSSSMDGGFNAPSPKLEKGGPSWSFDGNAGVEATAPSNNGEQSSAPSNSEGTGDSNTTSPPPEEESPPAAESPSSSGATFPSSEPKQTDKGTYYDSCYFFAMAASMRALGIEPPSGNIDTDWGDEIYEALDTNGRHHEKTALALFGVNFTFHASGDLRWKHYKDRGWVKGTDPCSLDDLPVEVPGVIVFHQDDYWGLKRNEDGTLVTRGHAYHAISIIRNADGTFSARDPWDGQLVTIQADPNNPGNAIVTRSGREPKTMQIQHLYWFQPPRRDE